MSTIEVLLEIIGVVAVPGKVKSFITIIAMNDLTLQSIASSMIEVAHW